MILTWPDRPRARLPAPTLRGVPLLGSLVVEAESAMATRVLRLCEVTDDVEAITDHGAEPAPGTHTGAEAVWDRVVDLYRAGVHPGIQLCIHHDGVVVLDRAIGYARGVRPGRPVDHPDARPMRTTTPVNLFSAGKAVSAMGIHSLAERGLLGLDDPVARHLPGFERHGKHAITVRQVLTHQAGIPAWPSRGFDLERLADPEWIHELVCDLRPVAAPGGPPAYHALSGGFVLEALTRQVTGSGLRPVVRDQIKAPLELGWLDLGTAPEEHPALAHNVITGPPFLPPVSALVRRALGTGWDEAVRMSNDARFVREVVPSANVVATAADAARFYSCLLAGGTLDGRRVWAPETVAAAVEPAVMHLDRRLGLPMRYSAGFMLGSSTLSLYGWNHPRAFGHVGLANSFTWADPDRGLVVALLTTGKAALGPHIPGLLQLIAQIHRSFPRS